MSINLTNVNIFLRANSPEELIELQLINNALNGVHYNYQTPIYDGTSYIVWFFADVKKWQDPTGLGPDEVTLVRGSR
jgi:hypothetical protein